MKWGKAYGPEYVNRLRNGVARNLRYPHRFICFTDDATGIEEGIEVFPLPSLGLPPQHQDLRWRKLALLGKDVFGLTPASTEVSLFRDTGFDLMKLAPQSWGDVGIWIGVAAFLFWIYLLVVSTSNGVNITDGLDGLATGSLIMSIGAFAVIAIAFRAVGSFLSWIEKQDESPADAWIDEDEFEEA
jgi:hypothetical protein